jgi:hypothetical protein
MSGQSRPEDGVITIRIAYPRSSRDKFRESAKGGCTVEISGSVFGFWYEEDIPALALRAL